MAATQSGPASPVPAQRRPLSPATPADQRRAKRDLLRDFYGLKGTSSSPRTSKASSNDPLDIDSSAFSAPQYFQHLVATSSLPQLLEKTTSLSNDISDLNSSRHSLVYNHHQQLFEAGDTIAHLNRRTPQLLGILIELQQTFSDIERLADSVSVPPSQAQKQSRAEAQRIAQLPETLGLMLDAGDSKEDVKQALDNDRPTLEAWIEAGVKGAQQVLHEAEAVLQRE